MGRLPTDRWGMPAGRLAPHAPERSNVAGVRLTAFWERMNAQFGAGYAESLAKDYVFANLRGRTITEALAEGEDAKTVWRAVCETFQVPERLR